jgi:hypothetical protein
MEHKGPSNWDDALSIWIEQSEKNGTIRACAYEAMLMNQEHKQWTVNWIASSPHPAENRVANVTLPGGGPICQNVNFHKEDHTRLMFLTRNQRVNSFPKTSNNALVSWIELSNDSNTTLCYDYSEERSEGSSFQYISVDMSGKYINHG